MLIAIFKARPSPFYVLDEVEAALGVRGSEGAAGHITRILWIEIASDISEEYYVSFTLDRSAKKHLGMLSKEGGVEIEQVAVENPDAIAKIWIDPVEGLSEAADSTETDGIDHQFEGEETGANGDGVPDADDATEALEVAPAN